ncbi:IclR family transcriptional regulator [Rhodobacteraceae bacterium CH30]|nr:IclR family transcriptional regulator [Rhodobacteraceae bacterium CH30]
MIDENRTIQSVERAMALLETLAARGGKARLAELSDTLSLNKSTLHGLLNTLSVLGYVTREDKAYALGLRLREIAQPLNDLDAHLRKVFLPALHRMADISNETVYLTVPCGTREYLYLDVIDGGRSIHFGSPRGRREGLTTSAIGKLLLAFDNDLTRSLRKASQLDAVLELELETIRHQGYALDLEEAEPGLSCVALPLRLRGRVVAALAVSGASARLSEAKLRTLACLAMSEMFDIIKL